MSVLARLPAGPEGRPERRVEFAGESAVRVYFVSALLAVGLHAGLILGWRGSPRFEPAEYGVVQGESAIEVELVAAPPETMEAPSTEEPAPTEELAVPPEPTETQEAVAEVLEQPEPVPTPSPIQKPPVETLQEMPAPPQEMPTPKEIARPQPARTPVAASKPKAASAVRGPSTVGHASGRPGSETGAVRAKPGSQASKPAYLYNPHPSYPEAARRAGQTGVVMLRVSINERGRVTAVSPIKSSGHSALDERARTTVQRWIFRPARQNGKPVSTQVDVPVRFSLDR
jgi:protein TonB